MAIVTGTIDHMTLARLVETGAVRGISVIGQPGGWSVVVQCDVTDRVLAAKRGAARTFRNFDTLVRYLKGLAIVRYQVDATRFGPVALKIERKRMDAHEAASYEEWLTNEVLEAIDDPRPSLSHEEVVAEWEIERAELLKRLEGAGS